MRKKRTAKKEHKGQCDSLGLGVTLPGNEPLKLVGGEASRNTIAQLQSS